MNSEGKNRIETVIGYVILYGYYCFFAIIWIAIIVFFIKSCGTKSKPTKDHIYEKDGVERQYDQDEADEVETSRYIE